MSAPSDLWCIVRTSAGRTLKLARSLAAAGFDVWTPTEVQAWRRPRSRKTIERDLPIMPTFVFARADRARDLAAAAATQISPHPPFSIFVYAGRVPLISENSVSDLRLIEHEKRAAREKRLKSERDRIEQEERKAKRKEPRALTIGAVVGADDPNFIGLTGVVEASNGKDAWIRFGQQVWKIDAWLVIENGIQALPEAA